MRAFPMAPALTFTGAALDRAALVRHDPAALTELLRSPDAVAVLADGGSVLVAGETLARRPLGAVHAAGAPSEPGAAILLGLELGAPVFAIDVDGLPGRAAVEAGAAMLSLRDAGTRLSQAEGGLAAYLSALIGWHRTHRFCANCGARSEIAEAGLARHCPACGTSHFPRTDPVVIMLVEHDDRLLLGRRRGWPPGRRSVLAGFVAPGETPEEAVIREVREESCIVALAPRYVVAQPWPFPASLMLGFTAGAQGGEPRAHDGELDEVGWFARAEVEAAREWEDGGAAPGDDDGRLALPPPISIARALIDGWLARGPAD